MSATIFSNAEIIAALSSGELTIERMENGHYLPVPPPDIAALDRVSDVQPASLDLSIGQIFQPPETPWDRSTLPDSPPSKTGHPLAIGGTVIVKTRERLTLSPRIGAFGFPPASMAKNSILMTNPGHVDPGFSGHLTFTIINMGRAPYDLVFGSKLVTLLVFGFDQPLGRDFSALTAGGQATSNRMAEVLNRLSPDFADFEGRSRRAAVAAVAAETQSFDKKVDDAEKRLSGETQVAKDALRSAESKYSLASLIVPAITGAIFGYFAFQLDTSTYVQEAAFEPVEERVTALEGDKVEPATVSALEVRLAAAETSTTPLVTFDALEERVSDLEGEELLESLDERLRTLELAIEALGTGRAMPGAGE